MGLKVEPLEINVKFLKKDKKKILDIFRQLKADEGRFGTGGFKDNRHYSFAGPLDVTNDLAELFEAFRYTLEEDDEFLIVNDFTGSKVGDDKVLWRKLKPLIQPGSVCQFYIETVDSRDDDDLSNDDEPAILDLLG